jgi:hypothetical protein
MQKWTLEDIKDAMADNVGFCINCGDPRDCCEPDARKYLCDNCGCLTVYGAEELVMMGLVEVE